MKRRFLFLAIFGLAFCNLSAQSHPESCKDSCVMSKEDFDIKENLKLSRNIFAEIGGPSNGVGVGYDQRFNPTSALGFRVGLAYTNGSFEAKQSAAHAVSDKHQVEFKGVTIPLEINGILGTDVCKFELGIGAIPCILDRVESVQRINSNSWLYSGGGVKLNIFGSLNIGFRLQRRRGFFMRVACAFLAGSAKCSPMDGLVISPNLALGYTIR